jgi:aryl-alcohol dehydrogenase-like predicted oxidoreductase
MKYVNLGLSGLRVPRLIFGGAHIGEIVSPDKAAELIGRGRELGISAIYAADDYNRGRTEAIIGKIVKPYRDEMTLIIKAGHRVASDAIPRDPGEFHAAMGNGEMDDARLWNMGISPTARGLNRKHMVKALDASLRRLQTDYVDVYSAHFWDPYTPIEETLETFAGFVSAGKVRYIACSQTEPWQLYKALWTSERLQLPRYEAVQIRLNLLERYAMKSYLPATAAAGVSVLAFNSLASGLLSGAVGKNAATTDALGYRRRYAEMYWSEGTFTLLEKLTRCAESIGRSLGELAQGWALAQESVAALLIGPNQVEEFDAQVAAVDTPLSGSELKAISDVLEGEPLDRRVGAELLR